MLFIALFTALSEHSMTEADSSRLPVTGSVTVKVLIPNYLAGALIGKGGEELNIIRKQTGGIIKLSQNKAYYPGTDERVVLIKGRPDSAFALLKLVHSKIRTRKAPPIINGRPFNEIRLQQMKLIIANSTAGKIIGTGGEIIKLIQQEHNVKLFITNVDNPKEKRVQNERICTIKGDELSVNKCMIDLVERIASDELADLDTNIDYPKCEDSEIIFGLERPVFLSNGMGLAMPGNMAFPGMPGIGAMGGMTPTYEDLFLLQEQTKALQVMTSMANHGGNGLLQVNPLAMNGFASGQVAPGLQLMMDPKRQLILGQKPEIEILTPEMAMFSKSFDGNVVVDQYADYWPKQNNLQSLFMQNPALAAQQVTKTATEQYAQNSNVAEQQYSNLIANSLNGSLNPNVANIAGLGKRFNTAAQNGQQQTQDLLNRSNGLTTSGIYQSPLMSHVATSNPIAAQTAALQAAQNAALQQQIQLQALQQQAQPNPYLNAQNSSLQALQDAQMQVQAQAAQIQALQAQSNQLHNNSVAQAQLHAQVQAQLLMSQQQNAAQTSVVHQHSAKQSKRYHPYSAPPPPPPPAGGFPVSLDHVPVPPKTIHPSAVSIAPQVQAAPSVSIPPNASSSST